VRVRLSLLGLLLLCNGGLPAQQPAIPASQDTPAFRTSTDLVTIDAVVTDSSGNHVTDLKREDFDVTVAGKRQTLDQALYIRTQDQPRVLAAARAAAISSGSAAPSGGTPASRAIRAGGTSPDPLR